MKSNVLAKPVLVGRESELEVLKQALDSAIKGKGKTLFISGEAGSGKTRLVNEFLSTLKKKEIVVLSGWCLSDVAIPYFPFIEALSAYFSVKKSDKKESTRNRKSGVRTAQVEDEEAEVKSWLAGPKQAGKSDGLQNLSPQAWQVLAFAAVTKTLLNISGKKTVILFIDDLQWADSASLALLRYFSRSISSVRILVLATYRSEELIPDAEGRPHPLVEALQLMRREDLVTEVRLANLDADNVAALAEQLVGGSLHPELANRLATESQGNPLFVIESLRMLSESGSLVQDSGRLQLSRDEVGIPVKIKDIILRRVGMLKPNQRRILDLASAIGQKFDVELLSAVLNQDSLEVLEMLNAVAQSSSLVYCEGNSYEFDHAKSREVIYGEISPPLKRGYHARIAEKMEAKTRDAKDLPVGDLAYHHAQSGNKEKAVKFSIAAGEDALAKYSNAEAIAHFNYVLSTTKEDIGYVSEKIRAQEGLGDALTRSGRLEEATKAFEKLSKDAEVCLVRLRAIRKGMWACLLMGDFHHSMELSSEAEQYSRCDRLEYARVLSLKGRSFDYLGDSNQALLNKEEALKVFREEFALQDVAFVLIDLSTSYSDEGKFENALAASLCSAAMYEELEDLFSQEYAFGRLAWRFQVYGFFQEALENYAKTMRICERMGGNPAQLYDASSRLYESVGNERIWLAVSNHLRNASGKPRENGFSLSELSSDLILEYRKNLKTAVAQSLKGAEFAEKTDSYLIKNRIYSNLTRQYAKLGELSKAEEFYKRLTKRFDKTGSEGNDAGIAASKASYFACKEQWKESNRLFEEALALLKDVHAQYQAHKIAEQRVRFDFGLALLKQGCFQEAEIQIRESKRIAEEDGFQKRFSHVNLQTFLMAPREAEMGKEFSIWFYIVNAAKTPGQILRIEAFFPPEFKVASNSSEFDLQNNIVKFKYGNIGPFQVEALRFKFKGTMAGSYALNPAVVYLDDLGEIKTCKPNSIKITVQPDHPKYEVLPGRIPTGSEELDALLFGGIPEKCAVVLSSPSTDEKELLIERFLEAGVTAGEKIFHIAAEVGTSKALAERYPANFYLFVCNPKADAIVQDQPNIFKLKGIENLTEIDISLTKVFRKLSPSEKSPKRICIEILSDVLLQHHAINTRRWLSALLPTLKSKGFTILAVVDPQMHPQEELQAVLGLFDGEIRVAERQTAKGTKRILKIHRMYNQKYLEKEVSLTREKLE